MRHSGQLASTPPDPGPYAGRALGLTRRVLFGRAVGSLHQEAVVCELEPGGSVERHLHAFEQGLYVLEGELVAEIAGRDEALVGNDHLFVERGVTHSLRNEATASAHWFEVSAPQPGADLDDTVFTEAIRVPEGTDSPYRKAHFDDASLPEPSSAIGLAGFGAANVGGAALEILIGPATGATQFNLMVVQYAPVGFIAPHDHAFEEGFFVLAGEIEAELEGETQTFAAGDYFWSSVGSMHALTNRSNDTVRWLETQVPQPPSRYQARFVADWERYLSADA